MTASGPTSSRDAELLAILERAFAHHAGGDAVIDEADLKRALGLRSDYLVGRVFRAFDRDGDGSIRKDEFLDGVRALVSGSPRDKLAFAFRIHDHDGDGSLDRDELVRMIAIGLAESETLERPTQPAEHLADALLAKIDFNKNGRVSFEELARAIERRPHLLDRMTRTEAIWIAPNEELVAFLDRKPDAAEADVAAQRPFGVAPVVVLVTFIAVNVGILGFVLARGLSRGLSPAMVVGRAFGSAIDFDAALILIPVMRRLLTRLRATAVGRVLPIDESIELHKIVGHTLFALAVAHATSYVLAYAQGHPQGPLHLLAGTGVGVTGALLLLVFAVMWVFSLGFVRRTRRFELFYFTHLGYVAWLGLIIAHAPKVLLFAGVAILGFVVEQILRLRRRAPASQLVRADALRSGVTALEIARPPGFTFGAGDYCFLRIPAIAKREWHPFTISSAPERDNLRFHVRSLGNWSSALRAQVERGAPPPIVHVDGPYGSPSAHIFAAKRAVLIGAGIGVTPFASVLESIVMRANGKSDVPSQLESAYFFWLNRDAYSFEWFRELLAELERRDDRQLLEIHLCMTGAHTGASALGLELARDVLHGFGRSDLYTGLRTHTHAGAPDWEKLLGTIAKKHAPEPVEVFFCGPPGLGARLRVVCARLGMPFREERF